MDEKFENSVGIVETRIKRVVDEKETLKLVSGKTLSCVDVAYETYGKLSESGDNVILVCHALSGSAHAAGYNSLNDKKPGWWDNMIGPGKAIDTDKYYIICSNFLGSCCGTTGPCGINPKTGTPYNLDFPLITISDMVKVQKLLLDKLGIKQLLSVVGGSMGGMQVLQWTIEYPEFVKSAVVIASTSRLGPQSIAFDAVGRNAILADIEAGRPPHKGLATARMIGHITYLSQESMREKFGRVLRDSDKYSYDFSSEFSVETYLNHQGQSFIERFDANSYLYITKAMDYFDLERDFGSLQNAFARTKSKFLIVSFSSDWLFTPGQSEEIVNALVALRKPVSYCNIYSPYGHDAFLLEPDTLGRLLNGFLSTSFEKPKLDKIARYEIKGIEKIKRLRVDYELIESLIKPDSRVLDVGCGDGMLLLNLQYDKNIDAEGIEVDQELVIKCANKGLDIIHRDIERGLEHYPDKCFDYAILSQTLQTLKNPHIVFKELLRVADKVIVSFPNFAYWKCRAGLFFDGRAPRTKQLPFRWYDTPNIHFMSLKDFDDFCEEIGAKIEKKIPLIGNRLSPVRFAPNIFAEQAIYLTSRK
ncbi:MAG: Homoserine O-acetyltransferase [Planctomycetes bacterium ADurb.Bin401]|nr:MAG: Homoserine O-acetyltransferase [Planctomycetes bacterium ADurb.Bin401]